MSNKKKPKKPLSAGYRARITQTSGEGITVTPGPTDQPEHSKHFLAVPKGHRLTEDEALEMGRALYDAINTERARKARGE